MKILNKLIIQFIFLGVFINIVNAYSDIVDPSVQKRLDKEGIKIEWIMRDRDGIEPSKITMKVVDSWMLEVMSYEDEFKFNKMIEEYDKRIEKGNYTNVSDIQDEWDGTKERERKAKEERLKKEKSLKAKKKKEKELEIAKYKETINLRKIKNRNYYVCTSPIGKSYDIYINGDKLKFKNKILNEYTAQMYKELIEANRANEVEIYYNLHSFFFLDDNDVVVLGLLKGTLMYESEIYQCEPKVLKTKEELLAERIQKMRKDNKGKNNTYICGIEEKKPILVTGTKYNLTIDSKIYQNVTDDGLDKVKNIKGYIEYGKHKLNSTIFYGDPKSLEKFMYIDKKTNKLYTLEKKEETSTFCEKMF